MDRRAFLATSATAAALLTGCVSPGEPLPDFATKLAGIEKASGGRLGAFLLDTGSGRGFGWRQDERFCHCSSFKLSLAALVLREAAAGRIALDQPVRYSRADLMAVSPVTTANVERGSMTMVELAQATQVTSDNAAANILLRHFGGPQAITRFWRELGDPVSRLDAYEPELNHIPPGTQQNSTTPEAMARTLAKVLTGKVLRPKDAARLIGWMRETKTGVRRIRAGLPAEWNVGDKTGTAVPDAGSSTYVDLALATPPGRAPLIVTGYFEDPANNGEIRPEAEAVLASVGRLAAAWAAA